MERNRLVHFYGIPTISRFLVTFSIFWLEIEGTDESDKFEIGLKKDLKLHFWNKNKKQLIWMMI